MLNAVLLLGENKIVLPLMHNFDILQLWYSSYEKLYTSVHFTLNTHQYYRAFAVALKVYLL